ncbi:hypothetical protein Tco_0399579, partial [Tanacetum coccineum]
MELCTKLQERVIDLDKSKTTQALPIDSLKRRVKKLEKKQVKSFKDKGLGNQEDASKQGRKIADIDVDAEVTLVDETQGRNDDDMFNVNDLEGDEVIVKGDDVAKKKDDEVNVVKEVVSTTSDAT